MSWFIYRSSSGELLGSSVDQYAGFPFFLSQIENPIDNRTETENPPAGKFWKYDGSQLRDATPVEIAAFPAARLADDTQRDKNEAKELDGSRSDHRRLRALVGTFVDELNAHSDKINGIKNGIAAAQNLAEVKAAMAAIPDHPIRTLAALRALIDSKVDQDT